MKICLTLLALAAAPLYAGEGAVSQLGPGGGVTQLQQPVPVKNAVSQCWEPSEMAAGYESSSYLAACAAEWEFAYGISVPRTYRSVKAVCSSAGFKDSALCGQYLELLRKNPGTVSLPPPPFKLPKGLVKNSKHAGFWRDCTVALRQGTGGSPYADNTRARYSDQEVKDICSGWVAEKMAAESNFPPFPFLRSATFFTKPGPRPCACTYEDNGHVRTYTGGHGYVVKFRPEEPRCQIAFFRVGLGALDCVRCSEGDAKACLGCLKTAAGAIDTVSDGCIQHLCVPINEFFGTYGANEDPKCDFERFERG